MITNTTAAMKVEAGFKSNEEIKEFTSAEGKLVRPDTGTLAGL